DQNGVVEDAAAATRASRAGDSCRFVTFRRAARAAGGNVGGESAGEDGCAGLVVHPAAAARAADEFIACGAAGDLVAGDRGVANRDRKSTRLNSSHDQISYAVFC